MCVYDVPTLARGLKPAGLMSVAEPLATPCLRSEVTLTTREIDVLEGVSVSVAGTLHEGDERAPAGSELELQRRLDRHWRTISSTRAGERGRFVLRFTPRAPGRELLRVRFGGAPGSLAGVSAVRQVEVFRLAGASWYGGGGELACGGELASSTVGVANRTLPVRHDRHAPLRRAHGARAGHRPSGPFVEGQRIRSHRSNEAGARLRRHGRYLDDQLRAASRR